MIEHFIVNQNPMYRDLNIQIIHWYISHTISIFIYFDNKKSRRHSSSPTMFVSHPIEPYTQNIFHIRSHRMFQKLQTLNKCTSFQKKARLNAIQASGLLLIHIVLFRSRVK